MGRPLCPGGRRSVGKTIPTVMSKLDVRRPIPGINTSERMEAIVDGLFPTHPLRTRWEWSHDEPVEPITIPEAVKLARGIPGNKAPGPDCILGEAMKMLVKTKPDYVANVFNRCIEQGVFSVSWKKARLVLLGKNDNPLDEPSTYRPLCMLHSMEKLLEKAINTRLKFMCDNEQMLTPNQCGLGTGPP